MYRFTGEAQYGWKMLIVKWILNYSAGTCPPADESWLSNPLDAVSLLETSLHSQVIELTSTEELRSGGHMYGKPTFRPRAS